MTRNQKILHLYSLDWTYKAIAAELGVTRNAVSGVIHRAGATKTKGASRPAKRDLTGRRFTHWAVIKKDISRNDDSHWHCVCDCGSRRSVSGRNLLRGGTRSCGCASGGGPGRPPAYCMDKAIEARFAS
jgi:hypothetical protein